MFLKTKNLFKPPLTGESVCLMDQARSGAHPPEVDAWSGTERGDVSRCNFAPEGNHRLFIPWRNVFKQSFLTEATGLSSLTSAESPVK